MFNRDQIIGFAVGVAASAAGFVYYKKNQAKVDAFLEGKGLSLPLDESTATGNSSLESLVAQKERLEDMIAEKEHAPAE